ncbi:MAG: hypothetical protein HXS54_05935 [Theionarchaea archaeon]|nr:hypothetical protein [Theionarchaea archaeon]DBA34798.1 TPA_asm: hypothetical protein vir521_00004 [Caudoviricetes sp. vir521]
MTDLEEQEDFESLHEFLSRRFEGLTVSDVKGIIENAEIYLTHNHDLLKSKPSVAAMVSLYSRMITLKSERFKKIRNKVDRFMEQEVWN